MRASSPIPIMFALGPRSTSPGKPRRSRGEGARPPRRREAAPCRNTLAEPRAHGSSVACRRMPDPIPAYIHLLRAKDLIDREYARPLDVPALAREAHASTAHFSRSFKRAFGETPHRYLQRRRIERAKELLRSTEL